MARAAAWIETVTQLAETLKAGLNNFWGNLTNVYSARMQCKADNGRGAKKCRTLDVESMQANSVGDVPHLCLLVDEGLKEPVLVGCLRRGVVSLGLCQGYEGQTHLEADNNRTCCSSNAA